MPRLPPSVCCVMASREAPPIALARRRARGLLAEIHQARLEFSAEEAAQFLTNAALRPSEALARSLHARTRGWIAGLQLLASGLAATEPAGAAGETRMDPGDTPVFEYFAEEVMAKLPEDLARFVSDCCVLSEFDPERAAALAVALPCSLAAATRSSTKRASPCASPASSGSGGA